MNILVTGCGGDIGFSIGKILKKFNITCFGTDLDDFHAGKYIFEKCFIINSVKSINYISDLERIVKKEQIVLIIPTSEVEIEFFQKNNVIFCDILLCNKLAFNIGNDKLKTNLFLKNNEFPYPKTWELNKLNSNKSPHFPIVLKTKTGCGSKNVIVIYNQFEFDFHTKNINQDNYIIQEYIIGLEYTCCIYKDSLKYHKIVFERELHGGFTKKGTVVNIECINILLDNLVKLCDLNGSINVQLRIINNIPYIFEINPRFSSTVYFRYLLNFNDLIWSIEDKLKNKILNKDITYNYSNILDKRFTHQPQQFIL